jgi:hypothetical protein
MSKWSKNQVEPDAIHGGYEFSNGDNLAVDELNAIVNNSFFASEKAKRAEELAESASEGVGTPVTLNGEVLPTWSADFAESERQKSEIDGAIVHENIIQGMAGVELWSNPSPKTSFPSQTITLSSRISNFDYLRLEYEQVVPSNEVVNCRQFVDFRPFVNGNLEILAGVYDGARYLKSRSLNIVSETQVKFNSAFQEGNSNDKMVVPMRIYGIKKGV